MAGYFAVEGAMISEGIDSFRDPVKIGAILMGLGGLTAAGRWAKNRLTRSTLEARSSAEYIAFRNKDDQAIRVGIFGDDLNRALEHSDSILLPIKSKEHQKVKVPALVPLDILEWYNTKLLKSTYGEDTKAYYYAHPPINGEEDVKKILEIMQDKLENGAVIVTDKYSDDKTSPIAKLLEQAQGKYNIKAFGGDTESRVDVFAGFVEVNGKSEVVQAPSLYDIYEQAIEDGSIEYNPENGVSLASVIDGEYAEEIWNIYEKPFEDLGHDDPTKAGFDKQALLDILQDPDVVKVVNRVNGQITTLCIFLQNFDKAPWFNKDYYKEKYPEYFETNNIFMFPGIVTDENKRGENYAMDVIDLTTKLLAKRGSSFLVTFECTEISSTYIPEIVTAAVNQSGAAKITGLERPISEINYYAVKKL